MAVCVEPFAHFAQCANAWLRDRSIWLWANVQEVIAIIARAGNQVAKDGPRIFPVIVCGLVTPTVIHRHAGLPRPPACFGNDALLGRGEVSGELVAVVHHDLRLQLKDHLVHSDRLPPLGVQRPGDVVPEHIDLAVVREQFANQAMRVGHKSLTRFFVCGTLGAVRMMPVHQRIVKAHMESFSARRFHIFADNIAARSLLGGVVVSELGVEVAKALMMLGCKHHVLHACLLG